MNRKEVDTITYAQEFNKRANRLPPILRNVWRMIYYFTDDKGNKTITAREINDALSIKDNAQSTRVRELIRGLIRLGAPIVVSNKGYYYTEHKEELRIYVASLRHRAAEIEERADDVEAIIHRI